jgi:hypothetical protein
LSLHGTDLFGRRLTLLLLLLHLSGVGCPLAFNKLWHGETSFLSLGGDLRLYGLDLFW